MTDAEFIGWPNEGVEYWNAYWRGQAANGFFDGIQEEGMTDELAALVAAEQQARDLLERYGVEDAQSWSAGDLVELANLIADANAYRRLGGWILPTRPDI